MPLKIQVEQVFSNLRGGCIGEEHHEGTDPSCAISGKTSQPTKLTVPLNPNLLSSERSKLYEEIMSTETKILTEI